MLVLEIGEWRFADCPLLVEKDGRWKDADAIAVATYILDEEWKANR